MGRFGFLADERGGAVPIFALALVPIIGMVGAAMDYSRGNSARTAMQASLDATALMLSRDAPTMTPAEVGTKATGLFNAQFTRSEVKGVQVTATLSSPQAGSYILDLKVSGNVPTTFTKLLGHTQMDIGSSAQVKWGVKKIELALVLDNTGSMSSNGKMSQLKIAAKNLLTTLQAAAKEMGDVKVAIIPFERIVNVGTAYAGSGWIDYSLNGIKQAQWQGCVQDRDQPNDVQDTTPGSDIKTKFPAVQCSGLTTLMPLTDIMDQTGFTSLNNKIDAMNPAGNTNVTIGLVWGWHALTKSEPLTQGSDPAPDKDKVIVLLTDGENTQNRWTSSASQIDTRTALACSNVKAANITVYTVRVIDGNSTLLRNCATKPSMYYDVQQASQLNTVFTSIAQNLANLRLAK